MLHCFPGAFVLPGVGWGGPLSGRGGQRGCRPGRGWREVSGAELLAGPWPLTHLGCPVPGAQAAALPSSPSAAWAPLSRDAGPRSCSAPPVLGHGASAQVYGAHTGEDTGGSHSPHLRSRSEPHAPAAAGGLRPWRWMAGDAASADGGLPKTLARAGGPALSGHFRDLSLPAPVTVSKSHPTSGRGASGGFCRVHAQSLAIRGIFPQSSAPASCPLPPTPRRVSPL